MFIYFRSNFFKTELKKIIGYETWFTEATLIEIGVYGYIFYGLTRMLMRENVNYDVTMNLPIACIQPPPLPSEKSGKGEAVHRILTWVIRYCILPL